MERYFLYIDILGFGEMVRTRSEKIIKLFAAIDQLNMHTDRSNKTIVFSDTIITFNLEDPIRKDYHATTVMYACEYVQDLMKWCTKLDIQFRAILLYGELEFHPHKNFDAYYGNALIDAYRKEKDIQAMGLFISKKIVHLSEVFHTTPFDNDLDFVFLTQQLDHIRNYLGGEVPLPWELVIDGFPFLWSELDVLCGLRDGIGRFQDKRVSEKYRTTYEIYRKRYGEMFRKLEAGNFELRVINDEVNWDEIREDRWDLTDLQEDV